MGSATCPSGAGGGCAQTSGGGGLALLLILIIVAVSCKKPKPSPTRPNPAATGGIPLQNLDRQDPFQTSSVPQAVPVIADGRILPMGPPAASGFGARFDVNTGKPIPKFDPETGKQNWWDGPAEAQGKSVQL